LTARTALDLAATDAFKALQAKARAEHDGNTQGLLVVYAVESFLRRLAQSDFAHRMVLKGGMLMAANNIRRMTKDADLSTHGVANDQETLRDGVSSTVDETGAVNPYFPGIFSYGLGAHSSLYAQKIPANWQVSDR